MHSLALGLYVGSRLLLMQKHGSIHDLQDASSGFSNVGTFGSEVLWITVLFTGVPATLHALQTAGQLASELGACIRILVPQVVPYPLAFDKPDVNPKFRGRRLRTVCGNALVETRIEVRICRDEMECVLRSLRPDSIVLVGARRCWWPTRETRMRKRLVRAGHQVILVPPGDE